MNNPNRSVRPVRPAKDEKPSLPAKVARPEKSVISDKFVEPETSLASPADSIEEAPYRSTRPRICLVAGFHSPTFSGRVASEILAAARGVELAVAASERRSYLYQKDFVISPFVNKVLSRPESGRYRLWVLPAFALPENIEQGEYWAITEFDANSTCVKALRKLRQITRIWVPSEQHAALCRKAGIKSEAIGVFSLPVNLRNFHPRVPCPPKFAKAKGVFRIMISGCPLKRKGIEDALHAYIKEFKPSEPVELLIKLTHLPKIKKDYAYEITDLSKKLGALNSIFAKVTVVSETLGDRDYSGLMASADLFVAAGSSFNSGLSVKEAMACALPVVVPDYLAQQLAISQEHAYVVATESVEMDNGELYAGSPAISLLRPKPAALAAAMREAFVQRNKARKMGLAGQRLLKKQPEWRDFAAELLKIAAERFKIQEAAVELP
ncbi:MAG: glycosyltransferase [Candidatus Riflebacteria bacterium]|nr:glycosyltransferase [Candidatus Riflebacteria bacterium]